ncbi:MAG: glycine betaine ABC transporter substrate-binding protein [Actinomycetota bacterium]|nr:glycine betaine ABC transporter substrate-binding protein [Actinomycetota bacterium]
MRKVRANLLRLIGLIAVLAIAVAGCGGAGGGGAAGGADLSDSEFTVGSKEFTEQLILGQITLQALEAAGATVNDQTGLAGTVAARKALESGDIDMYWEYTGTGWITHLGHTKPIPDRQKQFEAVAKEDLEKNGIQWLAPPSPANNTYAMAVRSEAYEKLGVKKLSDFKQLVEENPEEATVCVGTEFATRDDGLPGMEKAYGFQFPSENVVKIDEGQIYQETDKGNRCNFGEVFATDGRIAALDLKVIEDDKSFFPIYNPALNVRKQAMDPKIEKLFAPISEKLDTQTLQKLNAQVDVEGQLPEEVAEQWLSENGFV